MRRIFAILLIVLAALVAAGCGQYGKRYTGSEQDTKAKTEDVRITEEAFDDAARKRDGCTKIKEFESEGSTHVEETVKYKQNPPQSGDHNPVPSEYGLYDDFQPDINTVHNLEHGHILITYKGLSDTEVGELRDTVRINPYHLLLEPREKNPKDGVFYTAWTAQLHCERPSAPALQYMIDEWRDQGPELFTDDPGGMEIGEKQD